MIEPVKHTLRLNVRLRVALCSGLALKASLYEVVIKSKCRRNAKLVHDRKGNAVCQRELLIVVLLKVGPPQLK